MFYKKYTNIIAVTSFKPCKQSISPTSLIHRAKALCDQDSLTQEPEFLTTVFKENGYSPQQTG